MFISPGLIFSQKLGFGGNQNIWTTSSYQAVPYFQGIDKKAQIIDL